MPVDPNATTKTPSSSSGPGVFLFAAMGLALLIGAVLLGWKLSRPKLDLKPIVAATPTPAPPAPPEKSSVTDAERQEVLKRIDLMPNVTAENKERLYSYVEHARNLQRLLTVSFERSRTRVSEKETARVVKNSKAEAFSKMSQDAAAIFVVLGYADERGEEKKNVQISSDRASNVTELLRKHCGVQNVIQTVPMGSPKLFDPKDPKENRVAEVWAVLP
ncbi:MAG TPA: OmpA family protein [Chthoniobacter sp.]|jgi:outer membrane protein OmpA-like peptidoglycan-associated protein